MDASLDATNVTMFEKALKALSNEQLEYALDAGVRLLESWHMPESITLFTSDRPAHMVYPSQVMPDPLGPTQHIRKHPSQD